MQRLFLLLVVSWLYSAPLYAKTWAAQLTYGVGQLSPVFHSKSQNGVLAKTSKFCEQNESCRSEFNGADLKTKLAMGLVGKSKLFVTARCQQENGNDVYTIAASSYDEEHGRSDGKEKALAKFKAAGFSTDDCHIHAVFGVRSRKELWINQSSTQSVANPIKKIEIRLWRLQRRNATRTAREIVSVP